METKQSAERIKQLAKELDDALEEKNMDKILSLFSEDCEAEVFGIVLHGKTGLKKALDWLYGKIGEIKLQPIIIIVENDIFFEEFYLEIAKLPTHKNRIKAAEVLIYQDYKVTSLRLYLDRLLLASMLAEGLISKYFLKKINKETLQDLM